MKDVSGYLAVEGDTHDMCAMVRQDLHRTLSYPLINNSAENVYYPSNVEQTDFSN